MMETLYDPLDSFFTTETKSPISNDFLYTEQPNFDEFNFDPTAELPNNPELNFDMDLFQSFLDNLMSTETSSSFDSPIQVETEPTTREIGTDPMVEVSPPIIETTKLLQSVPTKTLNQFLKSPIIIIHTGNKLVPQAIENPVATIEYPMENSGTMTPSPSNHSTDDASPSSPEITLNYQSNNMITNLLTLPKSGPLILTNEELKLYKQEGYSIPTKLPLNKNDEKTLKRIQRKIKNKISAQDSRRKKKEYVETLEKQMERIVDENNALKERIANIEKSHRNLAQERDTLRSLMTNGNPGQSTVLMALVLFFAVLFGVWSPITMKTNVDDRNLSRDLALVPSNSFLSQNENTRANPLPESYKSRVLLSVDDHDHQHGPLLPTIQKSKYSSAAPGYTHSKTVERYMNKKLRSIEQDDDNDDENVVKKTRFDYERQEKVVIFEEPIEQLERNSNENKSVKIIRVERTKPAVGNDTLKLAQRIVHH